MINHKNIIRIYKKRKYERSQKFTVKIVGCLTRDLTTAGKYAPTKYNMCA